MWIGCFLGLFACARTPEPSAPPPLDASEQQSLLGLARQALKQYFRDGSELRARDVPSSARRFDRRVTFLTFHMDGETRGCTSAARSDVGTNVIRAALRTLHDDRYLVTGEKGPDGKPVTLRPEEVDRVRLEVNILHPSERLAVSDPDSLRGEVEPGVMGVRLAKGKKGAYYLPYVAIEFEYDIVPYMRTLAYKAKLKPDEWQKGSSLWRFETENFIEESAGGPARTLYRWNVLTPGVSAAEIDAAQGRAGAFLQNLRQGTSLRLGYHPKRKEYLAAAGVALTARTAEVFYGLAEKSPALRALGDELSAPARAAPAPSDAPRLAAPPPAPARPPAADISTRAAQVLALLRRGDVAVARTLGDEIAAAAKDGRFPAELQDRLPWDRAHEEPLLAVRALCALAREEGSAPRLAAARALFERAAADYGAQVFALADLVQAALDLHGAIPNGDWASRARGWGDRLTQFLFSKDRAPRLDYRGALNFDRVPRALDTARAAQAFARLAALGEERFRGPAIESAWFLLNLQYRPGSAFAFPHIDRYMGGLRPDLHHVSADLESTLESIRAWESVKKLLKPGETAAL
jgi:AMMECR1 domain-containing protein